MKKYKDEDIIKHFSTATSIADLARKVGLKSSGGTYVSIENACKRLNLDIKLLKNKPGKGIKKNKVPKYDESDIFCNPTKFNSPSKVKYKALKLGFVKNICYICGQKPFWNDKPLTMILDHIDGNSKNNCIDNLRIVCPNCDIQLPTSRGKNIKRASNKAT